MGPRRSEPTKAHVSIGQLKVISAIKACRTAALLPIAADPKHLGARIGITSVLHTWGSAMTHHPHVHMIVLGGGISLDGTRWVSCKPGYFLPVPVLAELFRRLFLDMLIAAHKADRLKFFSDHVPLADFMTFAA
jgi:Putative transposase